MDVGISLTMTRSILSTHAMAPIWKCQSANKKTKTQILSWIGEINKKQWNRLNCMERGLSLTQIRQSSQRSTQTYWSRSRPRRNSKTRNVKRTKISSKMIPQSQHRQEVNWVTLSVAQMKVHTKVPIHLIKQAMMMMTMTRMTQRIRLKIRCAFYRRRWIKASPIFKETVSFMTHIQSERKLNLVTRWEANTKLHIVTKAQNSRRSTVFWDQELVVMRNTRCRQDLSLRTNKKTQLLKINNPTKQPKMKLRMIGRKRQNLKKTIKGKGQKIKIMRSPLTVKCKKIQAIHLTI